MPHTVEEAYEVADAALAGDDAKLLDELGDLLFQVYFLRCSCSGAGARAISRQVARGIHAKLVRRHPHVFGDVEAETAGARARELGATSSGEQEGREGVFHDVPETLPGAALRAQGAARAAAAVGFEYPDVAGALADLEDELRELKHELAAAASRRGRASRTGARPRSSATCSSRA